jgi:acyl carrier protein
MVFRKPQLSCNEFSSSFELLQDAFRQYGIDIVQSDFSRELWTLRMDDLDFLEAIQLVEAAISCKIDRRSLHRSTKIEEVVALIENVRTETLGKRG